MTSFEELVSLAVLTYFAMGYSLVGYDLNAPPLHAKGYVVQKKAGAIILVWGTWPLTILIETYNLFRFKMGVVRYLFGIILLCAGLFLWGRLALTLTERVTDTTWIRLVLVFLAHFFSAPIFTGIAMPRHGQ